MHSTPSNRRALFVAVLTFALGAAALTHAGEPRTHDGFFLRLSGGGGYAESSLEDVELSGATGDVNFAIGTTVSPNFAIHGTIWGWLVDGPDVKIGSASGTAGDATLDMTAFGAGCTYYFMPSNFYISPSIGAATLSVEEGGASASTDTGFALDATVGKEWWVGDGWGIGVAGTFSYHSIPDGDVDGSWKGPGFAVRFTATMN
jgi:hypothetical protein